MNSFLFSFFELVWGSGFFSISNHLFSTSNSKRKQEKMTECVELSPKGIAASTPKRIADQASIATAAGTQPLGEVQDVQDTPGVMYQYLNPRNPYLAKRRCRNVVKDAWRHLALSSALLIAGIVLLCIGFACLRDCDELNRALSFFVAGSVTFIPGSYGSYVLWSYVRGAPGYTWRMLPIME